MKKYRLPLSGSEMDVFSKGWRRILCWCQRAGNTAKVKRAYRRKLRRYLKREEE